MRALNKLQPPEIDDSDDIIYGIDDEDYSIYRDYTVYDEFIIADYIDTTLYQNVDPAEINKPENLQKVTKEIKDVVENVVTDAINESIIEKITNRSKNIPRSRCSKLNKRKLKNKIPTVDVKLYIPEDNKMNVPTIHVKVCANGMNKRDLLKYLQHEPSKQAKPLKNDKVINGIINTFNSDNTAEKLPEVSPDDKIVKNIIDNINVEEELGEITPDEPADDKLGEITTEEKLAENIANEQLAEKLPDEPAEEKLIENITDEQLIEQSPKQPIKKQFTNDYSCEICRNAQLADGTVIYHNLQLYELMSLIYTDIRSLIHGNNILNDTYDLMHGEVDLSFIDIPEFRRFICHVVEKEPERVTTSNHIMCISTNLHGQTLLMLSVILNIDVIVDDNLMYIDDFGCSALDYSTAMNILGGYIQIQVSENSGYDVIFRKFNDISLNRYNIIRNRLLQYEYR